MSRVSEEGKIVLDGVFAGWASDIMDLSHFFLSISSSDMD